MDFRALYAQQVAQRAFSPDPVQQMVVERLEELRTRLIRAHESDSTWPRSWLGALVGSRREPLTGLYLWGGVGRGKTWLMDLFFQSLPFPQRRRRHFHRFMHEVHAQLKTLPRQTEPLEAVAEAIAREARVLCFDELFVSDIADAMILAGLFAGLFRRGVTLVATSNVPPQDLYRDGLQRQRFLPAIDLLEQNLQVLAVAGSTDYRLRRLTQAGTYLQAGTPHAPARLAALFAELSDNGGSVSQRDMGTSADGTIEIEGRPIAVVRESGGVVWFDFQALCAGPRSQDDYIEIARNYQSVIVSNVPILDELHENEARRFIALVDELYDHNVNLIVSAYAAPAELYRGERLTAQFERTSSRLMEMQSEEYLGREHRA